MPIEGRKPKECFELFKEFVGPLIQRLLPTKMPIGLEGVPGDETVAFLRFKTDEYTVPLDTEYGQIHFYLRQHLEAERITKRHFRLHTRRYWYRIQLAPGDADAVLRWEYVSKELPEYKDRDRRWCTHHCQLAHRVALQSGELDLNRAHLPTGWVTIEEVIRFLIHDLGVKPACGDDWDAELRRAEARFFTEFTSKRY